MFCFKFLGSFGSFQFDEKRRHINNQHLEIYYSFTWILQFEFRSFFLIFSAHFFISRARIQGKFSLKILCIWSAHWIFCRFFDEGFFFSFLSSNIRNEINGESRWIHQMQIYEFECQWRRWTMSKKNIIYEISQRNVICCYSNNLLKMKSREKKASWANIGFFFGTHGEFPSWKIENGSMQWIIAFCIRWYIFDFAYG